MSNILLSTTRMWNCGDDFIAFGVRNLLDAIYPHANYIAYNRNPDLHQQRVRHHKINFHNPDRTKSQADLSEYIRATNWRFDDSWHERHNVDFLDACVFAGTPEWFGPMVGPLVRQLVTANLPVIYLGVGGFERREGLELQQLSAQDQSLLRRARLITVRDRQAAHLLRELHAVELPCPALLSSKRHEVRSGIRLRIALSTQPHDSCQPPSSPKVYAYTQELFDRLARQFDCEIVCHYVDEIAPLSELGLPVRYSYDARDYFEIYNEFDLVVTTRVHGAGIAASLGIPSLVVKHSVRTSTADGFLSDYIDPATDSPDAVCQRIDRLDIASLSQSLVKHKQLTSARYLDLLRAQLVKRRAG